MKNLIITEEERSRILGMHQSATARQYLNEDDAYAQVVRMQFTVPVTKNETTGKNEIKKMGRLEFTVFNDKGTNGYSLADITSVIEITFPNGTKFKVKSTKDSNGNITGYIPLTDDKFIKYLETVQNITDISSRQMPLRTIDATGQVADGVYAAPVTFIQRDIYSKPAVATPTVKKP